MSYIKMTACTVLRLSSGEYDTHHHRPQCCCCRSHLPPPPSSHNHLYVYIFFLKSSQEISSALPVPPIKIEGNCNVSFNRPLKELLCDSEWRHRQRGINLLVQTTATEIIMKWIQFGYIIIMHWLWRWIWIFTRVSPWVFYYKDAFMSLVLA